MASSEEEILVFKYGFEISQFHRFLFFWGGGPPNSIETFELAFSVSGKLTKMDIALEDVSLQLPNLLEEKRICDEQGISGSIESIRLALRYETYLNSIYSLCETLGKIVRSLYPKENLPFGFREQKKRFLSDLRGDAYSSVIGATDWYDEVNACRSEATHFLSGIITYDEDDVPGYFNRAMSQRKGAPSETSKDNLMQHVELLNREVQDFLEAFGGCFLARTDPASERTIFCLRRISTGQTYTKNISLEDVLNGKQGTCSSSEVTCPRRRTCPAYENLLSSNEDA